MACPRCAGRRVVEEGRKTAQCPRCGAKIAVLEGRPLFSGGTLEEAQAFIGQEAARGAGELGSFRHAVGAPPAAAGAHARELRRIAGSVPAATGRLNVLKLILRKGFEAFGELTVDDLSRIAADAGLEETGEEIAAEMVEHGLAGRSRAGAIVPLREGR